MNDLRFDFAVPEDESSIRELLRSSGLPDDDCAVHLGNFIVAKIGNVLAGCVGLELSKGSALLRSLAVDSRFRSQGIGAELCDRITQKAQRLGHQTLYLLTTSAEEYFRSRGYQKIDRTEAPEGIKNTEQFRSLCPSSAVLMKILL